MLATPDVILESNQPFRLAELLPRWAREVPLYRQPAYRGLDLTDGPVGHERLQQWPLITKSDIRRNFPRNFLTPSVELDDLLDEEIVELEHTSGTSEERTPLLLAQGWWAEQERRALNLNPFVAEALSAQPHARRIIISSPMCNNDICYTGVPSRNDRIVGDSLSLSLSRFPFLWSEADLARMAAEAVDWEPLFLDVDPVYGVVFARYCARHGIRLPSLKFVLCSYEFVSTVHRRLLARAFGVPVFNLYGSTETGHLLMEIDTGEMRPSLETAFLELMNPDEHRIGELVVTTLTHEFMPLLRYRIGDLVQRFEQPIGSRYLVHGRVADAFLLPGGRRVSVWQVDQLAATLGAVVHYQLVESGNRNFEFRFIPEGQGPTSDQLRTFETELAHLLCAPGAVKASPTDLLMPEHSGKFRLCYPAPPPVS